MKLRRLNESLDISKLAKFIKESVDGLKNNRGSNYRYKLDDRLAVFVGWSEGFDEDDEYVIHDNDNPEYAIVAGIKVWTSDDMWTDFDWLNYPYEKGGDVFDTGYTISPNENYSHVARVMDDHYETLKEYDLSEDGEIITEAIDKKADVVIESIEDYEDKAEIIVRQYHDYKIDLPTLHKKLYNIFGNYKDVVEWLVDNEGRIKKESKNKVEEAFEKEGGPFWYYTRHGIGPGMIPKDVQIMDVYEPNDRDTYIALDKVLTSSELRFYDLIEKKPIMKESCIRGAKEEKGALSEKAKKHLKEKCRVGLKEAKEDRLDTPRGSFKISDKTYKELKDEGWGLWFDHTDKEDNWYKIMHDAKTNHAVAVLYKAKKVESINKKDLEEAYIKKDLSEYSPWSGAVETWDRIMDEDKFDAFESLIEDMYPDGIAETELNDWLWFEPNDVLSLLGIEDEAEEDDEE